MKKQYKYTLEITRKGNVLVEHQTNNLNVLSLLNTFGFRFFDSITIYNNRCLTHKQPLYVVEKIKDYLNYKNQTVKYVEIRDLSFDKVHKFIFIKRFDFDPYSRYNRVKLKSVYTKYKLKVNETLYNDGSDIL